RRVTRAGAGGGVAGNSGDPGHGPAQGRADLVDVEVDRRAFLSVLFPGGLAESTDGDDALALVEGLGDVAGLVAPAGGAQEQRLAVDPGPGRLVQPTWRRGDREPGVGVAGAGEPEFGVGGEVPDDGESGVGTHWVRCSLSW